MIRFEGINSGYTSTNLESGSEFTRRTDFFIYLTFNKVFKRIKGINWINVFHLFRFFIKFLFSTIHRIQMTARNPQEFARV